MRALNLLRAALHYRRDIFSAGLAGVGMKVVERLVDPGPGDVLLIWNRYGGYAETADLFERAGAQVLVAENCQLGPAWLSGTWYSLARRHVATTGGEISARGPARWDAWGVELKPFRTGGKETVILGQRGIGHRDVCSPDQWEEATQRRYGGRIRRHPGRHATTVSLEADLAHAKEVITWSSAAAVQALLLGVPVWHAHPNFVMASCCRPLNDHPGEPMRDEAARLEAFRRLAWAMWSADEIRSGEAFERALAA